MKKPEGQTLPEMLAYLVKTNGDAPAITFEGRTLSYGELQSDAWKLAAGLSARGIKPGDHVGLLMGNSIDWLSVLYGVASLGAVLVPINTWFRNRELSFLIAHSGIKCLIVEDNYLGTDYQALLREIGIEDGAFTDLEALIVKGAPSLQGATSFSDLREHGNWPGSDRPTGDDLAYILYTSGTTSNPKGVRVAHAPMIENCFNIGERIGMQEGDRVWFTTSLFWGFGCENAIINTLTHGACLVLQDRFEAGTALQQIEKESCTVLYATGNILTAMASHETRSARNLSSVRTALTFGPPSTIEAAVTLGAKDVCHAYGLTETYANCCVTDYRQPLELRKRSAGKPLPGMEIVIADPETHEPLPSGEVGEIKIRGLVMSGYHNDPEINAQVFDDQGYFLSGDLGWFDEEGNLYFKDRLKDVIKSGGINMAPAEIEAHLASHPAVQEAVVFGVPDEKKGQLPVSLTVLRTSMTVDETDLMAFCRSSLASYKVPVSIKFVTSEDIPRNASGKVVKGKLIQIWASLQANEPNNS